MGGGPRRRVHRRRLRRDGVLLLLLARYYNGVNAWEHGDFLAYFAGLWVPVIAAVLLVLNPDYSGHLVGGFSKRILRFPVATPLAVAVTLVSRTVLVACTTTVLLGLARLLFDDSPGLGLVPLMLAAYFCAQVIDWLRGPVSGLSSLIVVLASVVTILWFVNGAPLFDSADLDELSRLSERLPIVTAAMGIVAYAASLVTVRADRTGRRYGIPEIWEWPRALSLPSTRSRRNFRSPLAAQVWFEVRRSRFLLPIVAFACFGVSGIAAWWLDLNYPGSWDRFEQRNLAATVGVAAGLFFGAIAHGIQTRVIGLRGASGKPGYEYLQPLTDAQFALARIVAAAMVLLPTLLAAALIHFIVAGRSFVFDVVPEVYQLGISAPREIAWMFLGRVILAAFIALVLFGLGTRLFQKLAGCVLLIFVFVLTLDTYVDTEFLETRRELVLGVVALASIALTLTLLARAARFGGISRAHAVTWIAVWAVFAWLLRYPIATQWVLEPVTIAERIGSLIAPLGASSVLPLLYFGILRDVHRRRHPTSPHLEPRGSVLLLPRAYQRRSIAIASALLAAVILWLGWPATPRYVDFRRAQGYPATLAELDAMYVAPPAGQNAADQLTDIMVNRTRLQKDFEDWFGIYAPELLGWGRVGSSGTYPYDYYLYVVGQRRLMPSMPLAAVWWRSTEAYWERVTSSIAPRLREISERDLSQTRFPIDLTKGYQTEVGHLAPMRSLEAELQLDALHWIIAGEADRALDDVAAGLRLAGALLNEPVLISQLVRSAMIGRAIDTAEMVLNRTVLSDAQLLRLQRLRNAVDLGASHEAMQRGLNFETTSSLDIVNRYSLVDITFEVPLSDLLTLAYRLAYPPDAQRAVLSLDMERIAGVSRFEFWPQFERWSHGNFGDAADEGYAFIAPVVRVLSPSLSSIWHSEIYMATRLELLSAAIAVERFQRANGRLPESLDALVPEYLAQVPVDRFSDAGDPVGYVIRDNGDCIVYSVDRDGKDGSLQPYHGDPEIENHGDIRITVSSYAFRTGPQIDPE